MSNQLCECGCGNEVTKPGNRFINGHHRRGVILSQDIKDKMKESKKNISDETREKMSKTHLGRKYEDFMDDEAAKKRREVTRKRMLENNPFKNKHHDDQTKQLMKDRWGERKLQDKFKSQRKEQGKQHSLLMKEIWNDPDGIYNTEEYRKSVSNGVKRVWYNPNSIYNTEEFRKQLLSHDSPNNLEKQFMEILKEMKLEDYEYTGDYTLWIEGKNPDFINKSKRKIIELFGDYWHSEELTGHSTVIEETERMIHFNNSGYKTLIIWENEFKNIENLKEKVRKFDNEQTIVG